MAPKRPGNIMYETLEADALEDYPIGYESTMDEPREENLLSDDDFLDELEEADTREQLGADEEGTPNA
jgi:hypothetical protein